jgi:hypothetical protein
VSRCALRSHRPNLRNSFDTSACRSDARK